MKQLRHLMTVNFPNVNPTDVPLHMELKPQSNIIIIALNQT